MDADVKAGLLDLIDQAIDAGWSTRRACVVLDINHRRVSRWRARRDAGGTLADAAPGLQVALHGLLADERATILDLFDRGAGGPVAPQARSPRVAARDGVRVRSTVWRVLQTEQMVLPAAPARDPAPPKPRPDWVDYRPCQVWATTSPRSPVQAVTCSPSSTSSQDGGSTRSCSPTAAARPRT